MKCRDAPSRHAAMVPKAIGVGLAASLSLGAVSVAANPSSAVTGGVSEGGFSSDNVEWVDHIPLAKPAGVNRLGRYLYVTSSEKLFIFDVADPLAPAIVSETDLPGGTDPGQLGEDPATNGRLVVVSRSGWFGNENNPIRAVTVIDVTDKANPVIVAIMRGSADHTLTCLLDCTWIYGGWGGDIIDLRDPENPRVSRRKWLDSVPGVVSAHDVTEVRPGIVLTASVPMYLLDARRNPLRPRVLASSDGSPYSHGQVAWPNAGDDDFIISWNEQNGVSHCAIRDQFVDTTFDSALKTWDARRWKKTPRFGGIDTYRVSNGTYVDGDPAVSGAPLESGCAASWFDVHPRFRNGGLIAQGWSGHGMKVLRISPDGKIDEVGFFLPHGGNVYDAEWVTESILYSIDVHRGIDILRFTERDGG